MSSGDAAADSCRVPVLVDSDVCGRFAVLTITDPYTFDEWRMAVEETLPSFPYVSTAALLVDRRNATAPTKDFVERMVSFFDLHARELHHGRAAIITNDALGFAMGRMTQLKSETFVPSLTIRTFRDYDAGVRWLTME